MSLCMRVLHTSDWHLGQRLYGQDRSEEFALFLDWLLEVMSAHKADVLLIAGDVFDTNAPNHRAQKLYFDFLSAAANSHCKHVVVIGGNHDSPSFLDATKAPLQNLKVHVIGGAAPNPEEELFCFCDKNGVLELLVCAVPYLRESDVRTLQPGDTHLGDTWQDRDQRIAQGIAAHYKAVCAHAENIRHAKNPNAPLIAMGHLFTAGGKTGEGVRDLYIGNLEGIHASIFPDCIDYLALGHLHVPQKVAGKEHFRYSGSPLPMGFDERNQQKQVCLIEFEGKEPTVSTIAVPTFRPLYRAEGNLEEILSQIEKLKVENTQEKTPQTWLDVKYTATEIVPDLKEQVDAAAEKAEIAVLKIHGTQHYNPVLKQVEVEQSLEDLDDTDVFQKLLDKRHLPETQQKELIRTYLEAKLLLQREEPVS